MISSSSNSETVDANHGLNFGNFGDIAIGLSCGGSPGNFVRVLLFNESGGDGTLNFLYSDGSTLHASGTSLANNVEALIDSNNGRLEGQFILAGAGAVTTLNMHAFKGTNSGCEITGTAVKATL